jgi:hypothetical protein
MKQWLNKSNKTWLLSLVLLFSLGGAAFSVPSSSITYHKQTEVTVRPATIRATQLLTSPVSKKLTCYAGDLYSTARIIAYTQQVVLILKNSQWKAVSNLAALGHSHLKIRNNKEDADLPVS